MATCVITIFWAILLLETMTRSGAHGATVDRNLVQSVDKVKATALSLEAKFQPIGGISGAIRALSRVNSEKIAENLINYYKNKAAGRRSGAGQKRALTDMILPLLANAGDMLGYIKWAGEMMSALSSYAGNAMGNMVPSAQAGLQGAGDMGNSMGGFGADAAANGAFADGSANLGGNFGMHGNMGGGGTGPGNLPGMQPGGMQQSPAQDDGQGQGGWMGKRKLITDRLAAINNDQ